MAAGDQYREIAPHDRWIEDSDGNIVGVQNRRGQPGSNARFLTEDEAAATRSLTIYGAHANGVNDDTETFMALATAGAILNLGGASYRISGANVLPSDVTLNGPGTLLFTNDSDYLRFGARNKIRGVTFVGTLSSETQLAYVQQGIQTLFSSPTYEDYAKATLDGSDFTHTFSTPNLTVALPSALTTALGRLVVSSTLALSPSNRYCIWIDEGFVTGDAALPLQVFTVDNGGVETQFDYQSRGSWVTFEGVYGVRFKVGCARHDHTKLNLSSTFDLSKVTVLRCINDSATLSMSAAVEDGSQVGVYNVDSVVVEDCDFRMMKGASCKFVNSKRSKFRKNRLFYCLGGVTSQASVGTVISHNDLDLRVLCGTDLMPSGVAIRNHGVTIGSNSGAAEASCRVFSNTIDGASWAVENAELGNVATRTMVIGNDINAVHCGVSNCSTRGNTSKNDITLTPLGLYGIELPTADYAKACNNTVYQECPAGASYGIGASKGNMRLVVVGNTLRANIGINITLSTGTQSDHAISVSGNDIEFWTSAVYSTTGGCRIQKNQARCQGRFSMLGLGAQPTIYLSTSFYENSIVENELDGAGAYLIYSANQQYLPIRRNVFKSFTGNFCDVLLACNSSTATYPKIVGNEWHTPASNPLSVISGSVNASSIFTLKDNIQHTLTGATLVRNIFNIPGAAYIFQPEGSTKTLLLANQYPTTAPATVANHGQIYIDSADGILKFKDSAGVVKAFTLA
jgi:hypothetical protein